MSHSQIAAAAGYGKLAQAFCGKSLPLQILQSAAGFYIGTVDDGPCSRESIEYFRKREEAEEALSTGRWTQKVNL